MGVKQICYFSYQIAKHLTNVEEGVVESSYSDMPITYLLPVNID